MKPAHAAGKDLVPIKIAGLQLRGGLVTTIVEDHRRAHAIAAITVDCRDVWTIDAVVFEPFVEGLDAHGAYAFGNHITNRIVDHGRYNAGPQAETVSQICGRVE